MSLFGDADDDGLFQKAPQRSRPPSAFHKAVHANDIFTVSPPASLSITELATTPQGNSPRKNEGDTTAVVVERMPSTNDETLPRNNISDHLSPAVDVNQEREAGIASGRECSFPCKEEKRALSRPEKEQPVNAAEEYVVTQETWVADDGGANEASTGLFYIYGTHISLSLGVSTL